MSTFLSPEMSFRKVVEAYDVRRGPVVLGISGGLDSVCLLALSVRLAAEYRLTVHVVHVHHGIRGEDADADAAFVQELGSRWEVPVRVVRVDVPRWAAQPGVSLEEAARQWRYAVLGREAERLNARWVAVAHHADDQVETVLMHLIRGAGLAGLRGMLPRTWYGHLRLPLVPQEHRPRKEDLWLIRPLLYTTRSAIEAWAREHGLSYRFDLSNLDRTFFRNRLRHEVLPLLEQLNPRVRHALFALADIAAAEFDVLQLLSQEAWAAVRVAEGEGWVRFDLAAWRALPLALRRAVLRDTVLRLRRELRDVGFAQVEQARRFLESSRQPAGSQWTLPAGLVLRREYRTFLIADKAAADAAWDVPQLAGEIVIPGPGKYDLAYRWAVDVRVAARNAVGEAWRRNPDRWRAYFDARAISWPLTLRPARRGERMTPLGMGGRRVLISDIMANAKVPRWTRPRWPVLVDAAGRVLWVVGVRQAEQGRVTPATREIAIVEVHPIHDTSP